MSEQPNSGRRREAGQGDSDVGRRHVILDDRGDAVVLKDLARQFAATFATTTKSRSRFAGSTLIRHGALLVSTSARTGHWLEALTINAETAELAENKAS
jgi:hypothetical protein